MALLHLIDSAFFRDPYGAVQVSTDVTLRVVCFPDTDENISHEGDLSDVTSGIFLKLRYRFRDKSGSEYLNTYSVSSELPEEESIVRSIFYETDRLYDKRGAKVYTFVLDGEKLSRSGTYFYSFYIDGAESPEYQLTVYGSDRTVPEWFLNSVIYQIFPDRFCKGSGSVRLKPGSFMYASESDKPMYIRDGENNIIRWEFYGGNLYGIAEKLDYIKKLGADTVYLNPVFESVSNHRYDTADYEHVDGLLGGDEAFGALSGKMRSLDMRLILDGVFSHTGAVSKYFDIYGSYSRNIQDEREKGAFQSERSRYRSWYKFTGDGGYDCWWHVKDLPCVNELDPSYLQFTVTDKNSIVRRWIRAGASGWRLDVADELPDEYIEALNAAAKSEDPEAVIIGEVWEDATDKESYGVHREYFTQPELDSHTNYVFRNTLLDLFGGNIDALAAARIFEQMRSNYPVDNYRALVNMTGSHDVPRLFSCLLKITCGNRELAFFLLKAYTLIQFTLPGVPLIYYGDEVCMEGGADPENRGFFPWNKTEKYIGKEAGTAAEENIIDWLGILSGIRLRLIREGYGAPEFIDPDRFSDVNLFVFTRRSAGGNVIAAVDRFGRGREYLFERLETLAEFKNQEYNVLVQAGGYGFLLKTADN